MNLQLDSSWEIFLKDELNSEYFNNLIHFLDNQYSNNKCYPPQNLIFSAFNYCKFNELKVVILGQDPYHGPNQANGLSFSVNDGMKFPPSLINIFKELELDLQIPIPISGNLERWANQGILLLNATLTVEQAKPGSHQNKGWEQFTDAVIKNISDKKENIVFLLWGNFAKSKRKLINSNKHYILESGHPSPMSANKGHWFNNKHFSKTNQILRDLNLNEINW